MHPKTATRLAALRALQTLEVEETPLNNVLEKATIAPDGRAFARELVTGTLRFQSLLDWTLSPLLKKPLDRLDAPVRAALRLACYENVLAPTSQSTQTRTPTPVIAHEYAGLMRALRLQSAVGFVNAVARRLPTQWREAPARSKDEAQHLAISTSHPRWLVERWIAQLDFDEAKQLCEANNRVAPLCLRVNTRRADRAQVLADMLERDLTARASSVAPDCIIVERGGSPVEWPEWTRGEIIAQDEAAQLVALLAAPQSGQIVFDLASAPGGKTTHLAQLMNDEGRIVAADRSAGRLKLVRENAARLGLNCIETFEGDAVQVLTDVRAERLPSADLVLLDAPCSGTGTLRRRPDLKWRKTPAQLQQLVEVQSELLEVAAPMVKSGGSLVYSTCSLEPEENLGQIENFLLRHPNWKRERWQATSPHRDGCDGMFAAKLIAP